MNKELFIEFEAKVQVIVSKNETVAIKHLPRVSITVGLMTCDTHCPKDRQGMHLDNIR